MFLGWRIVALAFLTNFVSVGFVFYSYGVFFKALQAEFGGSRLGVSVGLTCMQLTTAAAAPAVGKLLDAGRARAVMTVGALLMASGFVLASTIAELWQFYAIFGLLMGVGVCMLGGVSSSTLVANWFIGRRGTALGLATMGISMSGVVMPPLGTLLIENLGFRSTFLVYAAIALGLLAPATYFLVVDRPESVGLRPDGLPADCNDAAAAAGPRVPEPLDTRTILASRNFWVIASVIALNFGCMSAILTHAVPHAIDAGFSPTKAAFVLSAMAGAGSLGKPVFGAITDRLDKRTGMWVASAFQIVGIWQLLHAVGYVELLMAGAVFGFGMGGIVPLQGALVGAAFGRHGFGRVMGLLAPAMVPINMLGVPLSGYIFDHSGSYTLAFQIFIGVLALSMVVLSLLRLPETEPGQAAATAPGESLAT
ncbi:MAG: MFS transporter [Myxococcales bacterium]|nr:MFS transporter [Myxococcales bacterium]